MPTVIRDLAASKKFLFVIAITIAVLVAGYFNALTKPEILGLLGVLWPVYLGSQGIADVGQKIADGRVVQEEMLGEREAVRQEGLSALMNNMAPLVAQALQQAQRPAATPPVVAPDLVLPALKKGDDVLSLSLGPSKPGKVIEDVPELTHKDLPCRVACVFGGVLVSMDRVEIVRIPPGTTLPTEPAAH